jgi:hypothetical protein
MKRLVIAALAGLLTAAMAQRFSVEGSAGFYTGFSGQLAVMAEDLPGLPLGLRLGVGFASTDALDDNYDQYPVTAGTKWGTFKKSNELSEWGQNVTVSLDVHYKLAQVQGISVAPYVGVRYNMFSGGYTDPKNKVSGIKSETFSSNSFGFGVGVRAAYPVMPNLSLVGDVGVDYYLQACIQGTRVDDAGNSTTNTVCPSDSGYKYANEFVTQPDGLVLKLRLGAAYRF